MEEVYNTIFTSIKLQVYKILIVNNDELCFLSTYFPNSKTYNVDLNNMNDFVNAQVDGSFDIIIDYSIDSERQQIFLNKLFRFVRNGGYYIFDNLHRTNDVLDENTSMNMFRKFRRENVIESLYIDINQRLHDQVLYWHNYHFDDKNTSILKKTVSTKSKYDIKPNTTMMINYSDNPGHEVLQYKNYNWGKDFGINEVLSYNPQFINPIYRVHNNDILQIKCGGGLWMWKSKIILDTLLTTNAEYLIYSDSSSYLSGNLNDLVNEMNNNRDKNIGVFYINGNENWIEKNYTKPDVLKFLNANDEKVTNTPQNIATIVMFRNSPESVSFVNEWKYLCEDPFLLGSHPETDKSYEKDHRDDQSIFSILCKKNDSIVYKIKSCIVVHHGFGFYRRP